MKLVWIIGIYSPYTFTNF